MKNEIEMKNEAVLKSLLQESVEAGICTIMAIEKDWNQKFHGASVRKTLFEVLSKFVGKAKGYSQSNLSEFLLDLKKEKKENFLPFLISKTSSRLMISKFARFLLPKQNQEKSTTAISAGFQGTAERREKLNKIFTENSTSNLELSKQPDLKNAKFLEKNNLNIIGTGLGQTSDLGKDRKELKQLAQQLEKEFSEGKEIISELFCHSGIHNYKGFLEYKSKDGIKLQKKITDNTQRIRMLDSLARLFSLRENKCCAVSIIKKTDTEEGTELNKTLEIQDQIIISYNSPTAHTKLKSAHFRKYGENKAKIIAGFILTCNDIESQYSSDTEVKIKQSVAEKKLLAAKETVEKLLAQGECGEFDKGWDTGKRFRRLVLDLLKVENRLENFPELVKVLAFDYDKSKGAFHAEQNIMSYYVAHANQLKRNHEISIGCEKLCCLDCWTAVSFFKDTTMKINMRGYSGLGYDNVYSFVLYPPFKDCCRAFSTNMNKFFNQIKTQDQDQENLKSLLYPADSESDDDNLKIKVPNYNADYL